MSHLLIAGTYGGRDMCATLITVEKNVHRDICPYQNVGILLSLGTSGNRDKWDRDMWGRDIWGRDMWDRDLCPRTQEWSKGPQWWVKVPPLILEDTNSICQPN